jgi:hypothetical protein
MKELTTKTKHIKMHDSGIVVCTVNHPAYMELEDGIENLNAIRKIRNQECNWEIQRSKKSG